MEQGERGSMGEEGAWSMELSMEHGESILDEGGVATRYWLLAACTDDKASEGVRACMHVMWEESEGSNGR
jgi:hypothetical protein